MSTTSVSCPGKLQNKAQSNRLAGTTVGKFYRRRDPEASPFYKIVTDYFDEFERVYPDRYGMRFGFWRPVIRQAIDKFLECGDLRKGFARVRCPDCGEQFFVALSCKQRGCCPSCDQKRALILGIRLINEVLAEVPHRQWVFTIPKRLRVYFRFTRDLLGSLCRAAYETVREVMELESCEEACTPALIGAVQSFGSLTNWNPHIHGIVADGVFNKEGDFVPVYGINLERAEEIWRDKVFDLLFDEGLMRLDTIDSMMMWRHSGFSIDTSVRIEAGDHAGMQRLIEYISRCPFSLARMVTLTEDGRVMYRANHPNAIRFPEFGKEMTLPPGRRRNYEVFDPLDFLASVTQHIPDKGEHQIKYYGFYSNKKRGMRAVKPKVDDESTPEPLSGYQLKQKMTWAALIKCVYEVNPLECPNCGAEMKIVGFIQREQTTLIQRHLSKAGLWKESKPRAPPLEHIPVLEIAEPKLDYEFFDKNCV